MKNWAYRPADEYLKQTWVLKLALGENIFFKGLKSEALGDGPGLVLPCPGRYLTGQPAPCLLPREQSILLVVGGGDALDAWPGVPICRRY